MCNVLFISCLCCCTYSVQRNGKQSSSDDIVVLLCCLDVPTSIHEPFVILLQCLKGASWGTASYGQGYLEICLAYGTPETAVAT